MPASKWWSMMKGEKSPCTTPRGNFSISNSSRKSRRRHSRTQERYLRTRRRPSSPILNTPYSPKQISKAALKTSPQQLTKSARLLRKKRQYSPKPWKPLRPPKFNNLRTLTDDVRDDKPASEAESSGGEEDEAPVYLLSDLYDILSEVEDGSLVALDIDETMVQIRHTPCALLSSEGIQAFGNHVDDFYADDFKAKDRQIKMLQASLKDSILVQQNVPKIVRKLQQEKKCMVFGLTARYPNMANATHKMLSGFGINLSQTCPFPHGARVPLPQDCEALCSNGVIFCDSQSKGLVLDRFIRSSWPQSSSLPKNLCLVDDLYFNCEIFHEDFSLDLHVECYHFVPPHRDEEEWEEMEDYEEQKTQVLKMQMEIFVSTGSVLSNTDVRKLLQAGSTPTRNMDVQISSSPCTPKKRIHFT